MENDQHSERSQTTQNAAAVERVENLIKGDCRLTMQEKAKSWDEWRICTCSFVWWFEHAQNDCQICTQAAVGGYKELRLKITWAW